MSRLTVHPAPAGLVGSVPIFADARIATHALVLASVAHGRCVVSGRDLVARLSDLEAALRSLGIDLEPSDSGWAIHGRGLDGLRSPEGPIRTRDALTFHLLAGLLSGQHFAAELVGPPLAASRAEELASALKRRGARLELRHDTTATTLSFGSRPDGVRLDALEWTLGAGAPELKAALLLSGLGGSGPTIVAEPLATADHCERQLDALGIPIEAHATSLCLHPPRDPAAIPPFSLEVPGDVDAAAYLAAAAAIVPDSHVEVRGVGLNPSRAAILEVLRLFGADVRFEPHGAQMGEPFGRLGCSSARLRGIALGGELLERLDDLGPALLVAIRASGVTSLEAPVTPAIARHLTEVGASLRTTESATELVHETSGPLRATSVESGGDPGVALLAALLGLVADSPTTVLDADCLSVFPRFAATLRAFGVEVVIA